MECTGYIQHPYILPNIQHMRHKNSRNQKSNYPAKIALSRTISFKSRWEWFLSASVRRLDSISYVRCTRLGHWLYLSAQRFPSSIKLSRSPFIYPRAFSVHFNFIEGACWSTNYISLLFRRVASSLRSAISKIFSQVLCKISSLETRSTTPLYERHWMYDIVWRSLSFF